MNEIIFREIKANDIRKVLSVIKSGTATPRTFDNWTKNNMTGIIGFDNDNVNRILPLEPRKINKYKFLWHSACQIVPSYRGRGICNEMMKFAINFYKNDDGFGVYRDKPEARAYNWYYKNNHVPICKIISLNLNRKLHNKASKDFTTIEFNKLDKNILDNIRRIYKIYSKSHPLTEDRNYEFWSKRCENNYYQSKYDKFFLTFNKESYTIWSYTEMRNEPRIDILELAYINSPIKCLNEIIKLNSNLDVRINRNEREIKSFNELNGIKSRWHTYVMLCFFNEKLEKQNLSNWNYQQIDFI